MTSQPSEQTRDAEAPRKKSHSDQSAAESATTGSPLLTFSRLPVSVQKVIKTIAFCAALITVWFLSRVSTPPTPVTGVAITGAEVSLQENAERLALAKGRREQALALGSGIESLLKELEESIGKWTGVQDLLRNEEGKRLAGNPQFVSAFNALVDAPRATREQAGSLRQAYRTLIEPVEVAHKTTQSPYLPGDDVFKEFTRLQESIVHALEPYRRDLPGVEAMRATARQQYQPAPHTLAEAIAKEKESSALQSAQMLAEREQKVRREADEMLAEANEQKIRAIAEEKAKSIAADTKSEQLKIRAQRSDIKDQYHPFLDKGRFRPRPLANPERLAESRPMSYADLKAMGVFNDYKTFARAGAGWWNNRSQTHVIDRQVWPNPDTEEKLDAYRELFKQFVELAPIWAEDGTLDP